MSDLKFKGTPGNWSVGKDHSWVISDTKNLESFSSHTGHIDEHYGGVLICESIWKKEDAQVIAASTDLLEALQEIIPFAQQWINENHPAMKKAKSAIEKAIGNE